MPEHKYTPGPWRADNGQRVGGFAVVHNGEPNPIGLARTVRKSEYTSGISAATAKANAMLMAAAPDLLQALEELDAMYARAWDTTDGGLHFSAESVAKFEAAHEKASAAIAKATGQA